MERLNNEVILKRMKEVRNLLQIILKRKANWLGHILKGNSILEGTVQEETRSGNRKVNVVNAFKYFTRY